MSENKAVHLVKIGLTRGFSKILATHNISACEFYRSFGFEGDIEFDPHKLFPLSTFVNMLAQLGQSSGLKHPGLSLAVEQTKAGVVPFLDLISSAPNVEVALQLAKRFQFTYSEVTYWHWEMTNDLFIVERRSFAAFSSSDLEHSLYALAVVAILLKRLMGEKQNCMRIMLLQAEDNDKLELEKFFDCPVSFNQDFDGFVIEPKFFNQPNKNFDNNVYKKLFEQFTSHKVVFPQNQQFSTLIKGLILQALSTGECNLTSIAKSIDLHPRQLQKRLAKEGLVFQDLLKEVRFNKAKRLLMLPDVALTQIAMILGYSEVSAFSRAFQVIEHCSPRQWRKQYAAHNYLSELN